MIYQLLTKTTTFSSSMLAPSELWFLWYSTDWEFSEDTLSAWPWNVDEAARCWRCCWLPLGLKATCHTLHDSYVGAGDLLSTVKYRVGIICVWLQSRRDVKRCTVMYCETQCWWLSEQVGDGSRRAQVWKSPCYPCCCCCCCCFGIW